ncbi:EF-hand domain-containing protein [Sphingomonas sp.]|uniref:EF-hand domain-containing protein n=1 Tax=Sphingomonas sp. TaxID=28214 RepID=UPI001B24ED77|nr:EF-hand domain-containing protein [Sphingomonas sp.]MBO9714824.1 EF-hand domain-containing protein [Sphingomonas sp.]
MTIDERSRAALARLTENEKLCLRRRLSHQTAKEMAIELGVSPHAVEKRLKMARTKLGLSSSLEAARLLALAEAGYGGMVPQPSDLAGGAGSGDRASHAAARPADRPGPLRRPGAGTIAGVSLMSLILIAAAATFLARPAAEAPSMAQTAPTATVTRTVTATGERRKAGPEEVREFLTESFGIMDRDHSGFIERGETPHMSVRVGEAGSNGPMQQVEQTRAEAMWLARNDRDGDGKVSLDEYIAAMAPILEAAGVPARWKPKG